MYIITNGNMIKDLNKGITEIAYKLPSVVTKDANNYKVYLRCCRGQTGPDST
jgi:actin-like ATPase involved in cell morphogenesis